MTERTRDDCGNDLTLQRAYIIKRGILGVGWCCAPKSFSLEEVQASVNEHCEPYLPAMHGEPAVRWTVTPRKHDDPEWVSPGLCIECPETRQHWFMLGGLTGPFLIAMSDNADGFPDDLRLQGEEPEEEPESGPTPA